MEPLVYLAKKVLKVEDLVWYLSCSTGSSLEGLFVHLLRVGILMVSVRDYQALYPNTT